MEEKRNSINDGLARESSNPILFDTSSDDDKERHEDSSAHFGSSPMRTVISEGATTIGKIQVGLNFQAVVPPAQDLDKKNSSQRNPMMVWNPIFCNDRRVDDYIDEACSILSEYLQQIGIEPYHEVNYLESPDPKTESKRSREFSVDCLMAELHENKYNTRAALKKVSENPTKFMTVWSNQEKAQFDSSYRTYKEALRMISKNIGDTKSCKDVVDYHYRFSIPEKFRRYKTKKRQHAHRMMEIAEDRVLNEKLMQEARKADNSDSDNSNSDEEEENPHAIMNGVSSSTLSGSSSSRVGAVNSRIRSWVRSGGGGDDVVGATQNRRNQACELLSQVQEEVGADAYIALAKRLKAFNSQSATSLSDVKIAAEDIMKLHPHLLARFMAFLPKEIRSM